MSVSAVTTTVNNSGIAANTAGYTARTPKQVLGSDDFMKLLSTQMANQDPLKPMEDTAFIAQMASFSSLNQMNQLTKDFTVLKTNQAVTAANSFIGREVTVTDTTDGTTSFITGKVTGVDTSSGEPLLLINGKTYSFSAVTKIAAGASTEPVVTPTL